MWFSLCVCQTICHLKQRTQCIRRDHALLLSDPATLQTNVLVLILLLSGGGRSGAERNGGLSLEGGRDFAGWSQSCS